MATQDMSKRSEAKMRQHLVARKPHSDTRSCQV